MDVRKIRYKRPLKLLTLLVTSMLIATASATIYYSLTMEPQVTVSTPVVNFVSGDDTPTGSTVNDAWCRLLLKSYPNATLTYEKAVNISNTDSVAHSMQLRHVDITPASGNSDVGNFTSITFKLVNSTGSVQATFEYTVSGTTWTTPSDTGYYSIPASTQWTIKVETLSPATASAGIVCDIEIAVDVQE